MNIEMDRYWLLTWTTYGSWLPGDERGFVSNVRVGPGPEIRHNIPGTPYDEDEPGLEQFAFNNLKCPAIRLQIATASSRCTSSSVSGDGTSKKMANAGRGNYEQSLSHRCRSTW